LENVDKIKEHMKKKSEKIIQVKQMMLSDRLGRAFGKLRGKISKIVDGGTRLGSKAKGGSERGTGRLH